MLIKNKIILATSLITVFLLFNRVAYAQNCNFSISDMIFGTVDTLSSTSVIDTTTLNVSCTGLPLNVLICPSLGNGTGGATASARQMTSSSNFLNYQLYSNANMTAVWGSYDWSYPDQPPTLILPLAGAPIGTGSANYTIYGKAFPNQSDTIVGTYTSNFDTSQVTIRYGYITTLTSCSQLLGNIAKPTFQVTATVANDCLVSAQNVDFGAHALLTSNIDATGLIALTCTPSTNYKVSLNGGISNAAPTARKMILGNNSVTYGLYKDSARSQPWGDSSTAGSRVSGTGTGIVQNIVVYGRVPPQTTPPRGTYSDTIVVTVTY